MAQVISAPTTLAKLVTKAQRQVLLASLATVLCIMSGFLVTPWLFLGALIAIFLGSRAAIKRKILTTGQVGEEVTAQALAALPKGYVVLHDLFLYDGPRTAQIDHLVLGPNGIFLFETKNHQGVIYGNPEQVYWVHKKPRLDNEINKIYNPIKQAQSHAYVLRGLINNNSSTIFGNRHAARYLWVQPVVVFANPNTEVYIEPGDTGKQNTPIIRPNEIVDWVLNYQARFMLTEDQVARMTEVILEHVRRDASGKLITQS